MRLTNKNGTIITDKNSWKLSFIEVDNEKHWEEGRSAYELAKHFSEPSINDSEGLKKINECLRLIGYNDIVFTHGQIEHESRFDKFRGKGRMQDLVLWGNTNEKRIVVCIEAKVDETFGKEIKDAYAAAKKKGGGSNAPKRIEKLIENFHLGKDSDKIRYQLVHYLAGSISEAKQYGGIVFMPIIVYHTSKFNAKKGKKNKEDYEHFHKSLNFLKMPNTNIYEKEFDGTQVYITYLEIDVIFTHAHEDHVGLISHLPNEMPIFMGEGTRNILLAKYDLLAHHALKQLLTKMRKEKAPSTARRKVQQQAIVAERTYFLVENAHTWTRTKPRQRPKNFSVGNIRITPFFNCHSCYDSHMFLIEADGQRIWHTGDYREHGYMGKGLFPTLRKYATNIDTLITEGTMLNREDICIHEHEVMTKMGYVMQAFKYVFVLASATDIERLASVKEAAKIAHKPLYTGSALMNRCMKIYSQREAEASKGLFEFKAHFFTDHSLATIKRKGMVLAFGTGQTERIEELAQQLPPEEVLFIYASWDGYYKDPAQITHNSKYKELHNFFPNVVDIHTSGHADRNTIHEVIKNISPRKVICIHKEEDVKL